MFNLSTRSRQRMNGISPTLVSVAERAIKISRVDFGIPESGGHRTAEDQNKLFLSGASKADGFNDQSFHQTGRALDFFAYVNGAATWEPVYLSQVACAFYQAAIELGVDIEWGGLWQSFQDMPHIQLKEA